MLIQVIIKNFMNQVFLDDQGTFICYIASIFAIILPITIYTIILFCRFNKIPKNKHIRLQPIENNDKLTIVATVAAIYVNITYNGIIGIIASVMILIFTCYNILIGKIRLYDDFIVNINGKIFNLDKLKYTIDITKNQVCFYPDNSKVHIMAGFKEKDKVNVMEILNQFDKLSK